MSATYRCRECGTLMTVENEDELMWAVLEHACVPDPYWLRDAVAWTKQRVADLAAVPDEPGAGHGE